MNKPTFQISQFFAVALLVTGLAVVGDPTTNTPPPSNPPAPQSPAQQSPSPKQPVQPSVGAPKQEGKAGNQPAPKAGNAQDQKGSGPAVGGNSGNTGGGTNGGCKDSFTKQIGAICSEKKAAAGVWYTDFKKRGWSGWNKKEKFAVLTVLSAGCVAITYAVNLLIQNCCSDEKPTQNGKPIINHNN